MAKVAKLVCVSLMVRVIVNENDDDNEIVKKARPLFIEKVKEEGLGDNVESIEDDEEIPYGKGFNDK